MKKILPLLLLASAFTAAAQTPSVTSSLRVGPKSDVIVPFKIQEQGTRLPLQWGFDLAWISEQNLRRGINFAGQDLCDIVRVSFRPTASVADGELSAGQKSYIKTRAELVKKWCKPTVTININDDPDTVDSYYKVHTGVSVLQAAQHWAKCIDLHLQSYVNDYGLTVESISPFNESDYGWDQGSNSDDVRKQIFNNIDKTLINDYGYHDKGYRLCGGNTLNCDRAYDWWYYLRNYVDEGNTHQLAGTFDSYTDFYDQLTAAGYHATNDELHNTMEAMVGVEHGLQTGIWWGTADYCRSEFMKASNKGERLGYGEHRNNWTAASVYRHDDGVLEAFVGSSERQALSTTFGFTCLEHPVWVDGAGPCYEYPIHIPGGTGYQTGQSNAETVARITFGEDVQPEIPTGWVTLYNKNKTTATTSIAGSASWYLTRVPETISGDYSGYFFMTNDKDSVLMDLENYNLDDGANIITYKGNCGNQEQWHLRYAGNGWFYIISRESGKCIDATGKTATMSGKNNQLWRILPKGTPLTTTTLYAPKDLVVTPQAASVRLDWTLAAFRKTTYYNYCIQRSHDGGQNWYVIAQNVYGSTFVDNCTLPGEQYLYRVAQQNSANVNNFSSWLTSTEAVSVTGSKACVMNLDMENGIFDASQECNHPGLYGDTLLVDGHQGQALSLASKEFMMLPHTVCQNRELTIAAWVYWRGGNNWQRIFDFGNGENQYLFLSPTADGSGMRVAIKNGGTEYQVNAPSRLSTNQWVHIAVTIGDDAITLYRDGEQVAQNTECPVRLSDFKPVLNYIGRSQFASDPLFKGYIDDFQIYNYSLSASEVHQLATGEPLTILGDVNGDGVVDIADVNAVLTLMFDATEYVSAADVNKDGVVDIADVNAILTIIFS